MYSQLHTAHSTQGPDPGTYFHVILILNFHQVCMCTPGSMCAHMYPHLFVQLLPSLASDYRGGAHTHVMINVLR